MEASRRSLLKGLLGAGAAVSGLAAAAEAAEPRGAPADAVGLLFDTTRCIGCKACVAACREANGLPADPGPFAQALYHAPTDLNARTKTIIRLTHENGVPVYVKAQCMHCVDPACADACMLGALQKREHGIVSWDGTRCVGCRYCQMACPFNVPKFEWHARNPRIVKCELCRHLLARGETPACARVCPREAVIYGDRTALLAEARRRMARHPGRYVPRIYGEHDGGGTQVLYLSHVPFERLGLPGLGDKAQAASARLVQHTVYKWVLAPLVLLAFVGAGVSRNLRQAAKVPEEEGEQ